MSKFIITGTGRCGTTYCKAILQICGIKTGHQQVFTWDKGWDWQDFEGDCSFMAVPHLDEVKEKEPDTIVIHVTRDINKVLDSWQKRGCFLPRWYQFYPEFFEAIEQVSSEQRYTDQLYEWRDYINDLADYTIDIGNITRNPHLLFQAIGRMDAYDESLVRLVSTKANSND